MSPGRRGHAPRPTPTFDGDSGAQEPQRQPSVAHDHQLSGANKTAKIATAGEGQQQAT